MTAKIIAQNLFVYDFVVTADLLTFGVDFFPAVSLGFWALQIICGVADLLLLILRLKDELQ